MIKKQIAVLKKALYIKNKSKSLDYNQEIEKTLKRSLNSLVYETEFIIASVPFSDNEVREIQNLLKELKASKQVQSSFFETANSKLTAITQLNWC